MPPGHPPLLFHKGELVDASAAGVSVAVRRAIRETQRKVVGMVLNAVDDHLTRADQLRLSWTVSQFHHLDTILAEAQLVPRAVVLTSDHGHILEAGSVRLPGEKMSGGVLSVGCLPKQNWSLKVHGWLQ